MYYLIVVFFGIISLIKADDIERCMDAAAFGRSCCKIDISEQKKTMIKECYEATGEHHTCGFEVCFGEKRGFVMSNGTIDKTALSEIIQADFEKFTGLADKLIDRCLSDEVDYSQEDYSQEGSCYLMEISQCLGFHTMANCPEWKDNNECMKIKSLIEDCKDVVH